MVLFRQMKYQNDVPEVFLAHVLSVTGVNLRVCSRDFIWDLKQENRLAIAV